MKILATRFALLVSAISLTACSSMPFSDYFSKQQNKQAKAQAEIQAPSSENELPTPPEVESHGTMGGSVSLSMDANDKSKLSRALDNPVGKSSTWINKNSGISFTVVPINKVTVNNNPYCREYNVTAVKNGLSQESKGIACVSSDGNWKSVSVN